MRWNCPEKNVKDILVKYPYLERGDVMEAISYAAWRSEEQELAMVKGWMLLEDDKSGNPRYVP